MSEEFDIQAYMTRGVESIVAGALKTTLQDPRESAFMLQFAAASKKASKRRAEAEKNGEHIPPFQSPASPQTAICTVRAVIPAAIMQPWTRRR